MTYQEFTDTIPKAHIPNYYELLLMHSSEIVEETLTKPKLEVARKLNLSRPKFSILLKLLIAHRSLSNKDLEPIDAV